MRLGRIATREPLAREQTTKEKIIKEKTNRDLRPPVRSLRIGRCEGSCRVAAADERSRVAPSPGVVKRFSVAVDNCHPRFAAGAVKADSRAQRGRSEAETSHLLSSPHGSLFTSERARRVVYRSLGQHRDQNSEQTIGDAAEGAAMSMATLPKSLVVGAASWIVLKADTTPVIRRLAQSVVTGVPHLHKRLGAALAAPRRHGRRACPETQSAIIAVGQRPRGLSEHRGEDFSPDAW